MKVTIATILRQCSRRVNTPKAGRGQDRSRAEATEGTRPRRPKHPIRLVRLVRSVNQVRQLRARRFRPSASAAGQVRWLCRSRYQPAIPTSHSSTRTSTNRRAEAAALQIKQRPAQATAGTPPRGGRSVGGCRRRRRFGRQVQELRLRADPRFAVARMAPAVRAVGLQHAGSSRCRAGYAGMISCSMRSFSSGASIGNITSTRR